MVILFVRDRFEPRKRQRKFAEALVLICNDEPALVPLQEGVVLASFAICRGQSAEDARGGRCAVRAPVRGTVRLSWANRGGRAPRFGRNAPQQLGLKLRAENGCND